MMRLLLTLLVFGCGQGAPIGEPAESSHSEPTSGRREQAPHEATKASPSRTAGPSSPVAGESPRENSATETVYRGTDASPITPVIGPWVRYRVTWRNGVRSTARYSLVDREAGGFWVEVEDRRPGGTKVFRMHLRPRDGESP